MQKNTAASTTTLIAEMLQQRQQVTAQMARLDTQILNLTSMLMLEAHQPLTQKTVKEIISENMGELKVREHMLYADISSSTYYKVMNDAENVKVKTLLSVLNTVGLTLFIGKQLAQPVALPTRVTGGKND
jgi:DNA-binding phage protein